ncbi:protoheme IX farnesyltransferase, partial [Providencia stuartii]
WLGMAISGFKTENDDRVWARKLFIFSIVAITSLSVMMSVDPIVSSDTVIALVR